MVPSGGAVLSPIVISLSFLQETREKTIIERKNKTLFNGDDLSYAKNMINIAVTGIRRKQAMKSYSLFFHPFRIIFVKKRDCFNSFKIIEHPVMLIGRVNIVRIEPKAH